MGKLQIMNEIQIWKKTRYKKLEYILYDSLNIYFSKRQNWSMVLEINIALWGKGSR